MSDKEKLEEIKSRHKEDVYDCKLGRFDIHWLIEQAGLTQEFAKKNAELNEFLQGYQRPKDLGRNVIDVAIDMIKEQEKRVDELEKAIGQKTLSVQTKDYIYMGPDDSVSYKLISHIQELEEEKERYQSGRNVAVATKMKMDDLEKQNKRYRETLEEILDSSTNDIAEFLARKALEGEE